MLVVWQDLGPLGYETTFGIFAAAGLIVVAVVIRRRVGMGRRRNVEVTLRCLAVETYLTVILHRGQTGLAWTALSGFLLPPCEMSHVRVAKCSSLKVPEGNGKVLFGETVRFGVFLHNLTPAARRM